MTRYRNLAVAALASAVAVRLRRRRRRKQHPGGAVHLLRGRAAERSGGDAGNLANRERHPHDFPRRRLQHRYGDFDPEPRRTGSCKLTYGATGAISAIDFSTPSASASFVGATCASGVCSAETASSVAVVIDARAAVVGWNYQTFGVWLQRKPARATFQAGAISAGAVTPGTRRTDQQQPVISLEELRGST